MAHWLAKSEPEVFSIDDLAKAKGKTTAWDGVRNYQARNYLRAMHEGDQVLFYHSNAEPPGVAGVVTVVREAYPEKTTDEGEWSCVDVKLVKKFPHLLSLEVLRKTPELSAMTVLRKGNRLSVMPVSEAEFDTIVRLGSASARGS